jgi:hypothetical protein
LKYLPLNPYYLNPTSLHDSRGGSIAVATLSLGGQFYIFTILSTIMWLPIFIMYRAIIRNIFGGKNANKTSLS